MAISVNWSTQVITVPKADTTLVDAGPPEIRSYDVDAFRLELKAAEASEAGMPWPDTHTHNTEVTLSGITYARQVQITNGYTVEFEDGQYTVQLSGANHNLADVKVANQVSIVVQNSAGLVNTGTPITAADVWNEVITGTDSASQILSCLRADVVGKKTKVGNLYTFYDPDGTTVLFQMRLVGDVWEPVVVP